MSNDETRKNWEQWARGLWPDADYSRDPDEPETYLKPDTQLSWETWQAQEQRIAELERERESDDRDWKILADESKAESATREDIVKRIRSLIKAKRYNARLREALREALDCGGCLTCRSRFRALLGAETGSGDAHN